MDKKKITLILPAFNEESTIKEIVEKASHIVDQVIVVDNNSEDKTLELIKDLKIIKVKHCYNIGKSNSMKTGCDLAIKLGTDYIAFMDTDGQHDLNDLKKICQDIMTSNNCDMIIGYRKNLDEMPLVRKMGTILLRNTVRVLFNYKIYDVQSGLRIFKSGIYQKIFWKSTGMTHYFADAEITINAIKKKMNIFQIPIKTIASKKYKGMNILQGLYLILNILAWRFI